MKYTSKSINYLKKLKENGESWKKIVEKWNKKFSKELGNKTFSALEKTYRVYRDVNLVDEDFIEPHPLSDFTKESIGDIIKEKNIKKGVFFITAASPVTSLSETEFKRINKKRYEYALFTNKKHNKEIIKVEEKNGKYYELVGKNLFEKGFKSITNFCKKRNAELLILPMRSHMKALQEQPSHFDSRLLPCLDNFVTDMTFNDNLMVFDAQLNPQQVNPLTGLDRIKNVNGKNTSLIVAHPKQMYEPKASGNNKKPRMIYSTGCITKPEYLNNRIGRIARNDHEYGGIIVEVKGEKFFIRAVQIDDDGTFVDLGYRYYPNGKTKKERAEYISIGDEHALHTSKELRKTLHNILKELDPKVVGRHDIFDGSSVNPHISNNYYQQAKMPDHFKSLEKELKITKETVFDIKPYIKKDTKILMIDCNHHDFLERYLKAGKYINDKINYEIAHRMIVMKLDGKNPLKEYIDPNDELIWLGSTDDYYIEGYQVNVHGHLGPDGARGSNINLEKTYGKVMKAHDHKIIKRYGLISSGHFSSDRHGYNKGASTWLPGVGVIYKGGQVQNIIVIDGEWRL